MSIQNAIAFFKECEKETLKFRPNAEYSDDAISVDPHKYGRVLSEGTSREMRRRGMADEIGYFSLGDAQFWAEHLAKNQ